MNTYKFELRMLKPWTWLIATAGVVVVVMTMYPMVEKDAQEFMRVLDNMPAGFQAAFNMNSTMVFSALGFFSYALNYIKMIAGVQAMLWGATIITKERRFHTAEFLLAKPQERSRILTAKVAAVITGLLLTSIVFIIMSTSMLSVYGKGYDGKQFALIILGFLGVELTFFSLGLLVGVAFQKVKNPLGICLATVLGTYAAGSVGGMSDSKFFKFISPFEHYPATAIIENGKYDLSLVFFALVLSAACIAASYFIFNRQDVK